jgi:hypothetical protein
MPGVGRHISLEGEYPHPLIVYLIDLRSQRLECFYDAGNALLEWLDCFSCFRLLGFWMLDEVVEDEGGVTKEH